MYGFIINNLFVKALLNNVEYSAENTNLLCINYKFDASV